METVPLITIDINHYIKDWIIFFRKYNITNRLIKTFYIASIGLITQSSSLKEVTVLVKMLLTVAMSPTDGNIQDLEDLTTCEKYRKELTKMITGEMSSFQEIVDQEILFSELESDENSHKGSSINTSDDSFESRNMKNKRKILKRKRKDNIDSDNSSDIQEDKTEKKSRLRKSRRRRSEKMFRKNVIKNTKWGRWALDIQNKVQLVVESESGERINPYANEHISNRIIKELRHLPMWTNVYNKKFEPVKIMPRSSSAVECEIKRIKNAILKKKGKMLRIDAAVTKIIQYYDGKFKLDYDKEDQFNRAKVNTNISRTTITNETEQESPNIIQEKIHEVESLVCSSCGLEVKDANKCRLCGRNVHVLPTCSMSDGEEEGYGLRRICLPCTAKPDFTQKEALTELENHKGLPLKDITNSNRNKRRNRYLGQSKEKIKDIFLYEKSKTTKTNIPILKNGNTLTLQFINLEGGRISLKNTCGLDSLFQLYLVTAADYSDFQKYLLNCYSAGASDEENIFLDMVCKGVIKGISAFTYTLRAKILLKYTNKRMEPNTSCEIDCRTELDQLIMFLHKNRPSFRLSGSCMKGCTKLDRTEIYFLMHIDDLSSSIDFQNMITKHFFETKTCKTCYEKFSVNVICGK